MYQSNKIKKNHNLEKLAEICKMHIPQLFHSVILTKQSNMLMPGSRIWWNKRRCVLIALDFMGSVSPLLKGSMCGFWQGIAPVLESSILSEMSLFVLYSPSATSSLSSCSEKKSCPTEQTERSYFYWQM